MEATTTRETVFDAESIRIAKDEAKNRILDDKERVSADVWPVLEHIAKHLFEIHFDATALRNAKLPPDKKKPRKTALRELKEKLGFTVARYIKKQRMLTAKRLLETTGREVQDVAEMVCAVGTQDFSSTFKAWEDQRRTPVEYRQDEGSARYTEKDWLRAWISCWLDNATPEQCAMLAAAERAQISSRGMEDVAEVQARAVVDFLAEEGLEVAIEAARATTCSTMDLFEALSRHSREKGRKKRRWGVELAEVALAVIEASVERLGDRAADGLALGWERLANARRLAADFEGAEAAMRRSEEEAVQAAEPTRAEVLMLKGTLRLFQRRFTEALNAYGEAVSSSQAAVAEMVLVDTLLQRASVHLYLGEPAEALPDLDKARLLIPPGDERRRSIVVQHSLDAAILSDDAERAREILPEARGLSLAADDRALPLQVRWLEGWLLRAEGALEAAEPLLKEARRGFGQIEDIGMMAVVSLELALLCLELGRAEDVLHHASQALPALEALEIPEALGTITLLGQAIGRGEISRTILSLARRRLLSPYS